ncbi:hypothetical protein OROHE_012417 [Orobanche hederae]
MFVFNYSTKSFRANENIGRLIIQEELSKLIFFTHCHIQLLSMNETSVFTHKARKVPTDSSELVGMEGSSDVDITHTGLIKDYRKKQVNTNSSSKPSNASAFLYLCTEMDARRHGKMKYTEEKQVNTNSSSKTSNASVEEEGVQSILMPLVAKWM